LAFSAPTNAQTPCQHSHQCPIRTCTHLKQHSSIAWSSPTRCQSCRWLTDSFSFLYQSILSLPSLLPTSIYASLSLKVVIPYLLLHPLSRNSNLLRHVACTATFSQYFPTTTRESPNPSAPDSAANYSRCLQANSQAIDYEKE
jgi:hypothetical protein